MEVSNASHQIIADLLEARTGQHMSETRRWRVTTALAGLFREQGISNVDQLVCLLADRKSGDLSKRVVEALLNNETYFFRDRMMFDQLALKVLPELARKRAATKRLAIWSAGCSTGQEAMSVAMMILDHSAMWKDWTIDIVGTDVSHKAIEAAREACYSQFEIQRGLGVGQMLTYFEETPQGWRAKRNLRTMVRYKQRNMLDPVEIEERFDLILCRNVLLYFDPARREIGFDRLADSLRPDGWLLLGAGETAQGRTTRFRPTEGHQGLFVRTSETEARQRHVIRSALHRTA